MEAASKRALSVDAQEIPPIPHGQQPGRRKPPAARDKGSYRRPAFLKRERKRRIKRERLKLRRQTQRDHAEAEAGLR